MLSSMNPISTLAKMMTAGFIFMSLAACSLFDNLDENKPNGESLYNNNCARCHGYDAKGGTIVDGEITTDIQGRTVAELKASIGTSTEPGLVPEMSFLIDIFTDEQLQAISDYLLDLLVVSSSVYQPEAVYVTISLGADDHSGELLIRDRDGRLFAGASGADGRFEMHAPALQFPLLLDFTGTAPERHFYGRADRAGEVTISVLSDLLVRDVLADAQLQSLTRSCDDGGDCSDLFAFTGSDSRLTGWRLQQRLADRGINLDTGELLAAPSADLLLLAGELRQGRLQTCDNPGNYHGYIFDHDHDGDCYPDHDLDRDGFDDRDLNRDGLPDS